MQYGLRSLLLKTNFDTEKVQDGKKVEFYWDILLKRASNSVRASRIIRSALGHTTGGKRYRSGLINVAAVVNLYNTDQPLVSVNSISV